MPILKLTSHDKAMLAGELGPATEMAMRILTTMAHVYEADRLLDIESAHIDGCLYHGLSGLEFAERLVAGGARVSVLTTLNVGAIDLLHPEHFQGTAVVADRARRLMAAYEEMGCRPIWTCTPYQTTMQRPALGMQVAWAESNAIVFANSVLGARTNRYGDFIDICAAITGRAPAVGLHLTENRRGQIVFELGADIPETLLHEDVLYPVLGYLIGAQSGGQIPVIVGLPTTVSEDQLKALGAAAASAGAVALFHVVGVTPEASTLAKALQHHPPQRVVQVDGAMLKAALGHLSTVADGRIAVVALGSPHFSIAEFEQLRPLVQQYPPQIEFIVCTNRLVLTMLQERGWVVALKAAGVQIVVDTCVVVTPIVKAAKGVLMTNSGKFAHYAPGNIGLQVVYGSLQECVRSAALGHVWRDSNLW